MKKGSVDAVDESKRKVERINLHQDQEAGILGLKKGVEMRSRPSHKAANCF